MVLMESCTIDIEHWILHPYSQKIGSPLVITLMFNSHTNIFILYKITILIRIIYCIVYVFTINELCFNWIIYFLFPLGRIPIPMTHIYHSIKLSFFVLFLFAFITQITLNSQSTEFIVSLPLICGSTPTTITIFFRIHCVYLFDWW